MRTSAARPRRARLGAVDYYKLIVTVVMLGLLTGTLSWLQGRFDSADHQKATKLVRDYQGKKDGPSIEQLVLRRHPYAKSADLSWTSEIISSCLGHVRVTGYVPSKAGHPTKRYAFDVDLTGEPGPTIHPTDPETIEIIKGLTATSTGATTPGSADAD